MTPRPISNDPARWCDRADGLGNGDRVETAIGAAFKRVRQATEPSDAALAHLARRRLARLDRAGGSKISMPLVRRLALSAALVIVMGGAVGAALNKWRQTIVASEHGPVGAAPGVPSTASKPARRRRRVASEIAGPTGEDTRGAPLESESAQTPDTPASPILAPPAVGPSPPDVAPPSSVTRLRVTPPRNVGVARESDRAQSPRTLRSPARHTETNSEASVLVDAFRELRTGGDSAAALRLLEDYDRRFPDGLLRNEARIARAEALMSLDRRAEALSLLEGIEEHGGTLTRDVRVARAELLADAGRCADALRDFSGVLAAKDDDTAGGRALYGRASCRLKTGDIRAARADLSRYVFLHPQGSFATAARRALDVLP